MKYKHIIAKFLPTAIKTKAREHFLATAPASVHWQKLGLQYTLRSGLNIKVASSGDWWVYNEIFVDAEYDEPIRMALEATPSGVRLNILDLGANVGFFAIRVIDMMMQQGVWGGPIRITMVEGSPRVFAQLKSRLASLNVPFENFRLIHGLVGLREGGAKIYELESHAQNTIISDSDTPGVPVPFVDLYSLFDSSEEEINLLKCDIEGAEQLLLENYSKLLQQVGIAVVELHHDKCDVGKCRDMIRSAGLIRHRILRHCDFTTTELFWK